MPLQKNVPIKVPAPGNILPIAAPILAPMAIPPSDKSIDDANPVKVLHVESNFWP